MLVRIYTFMKIYRPFEYERVYLPLYQVADTPFRIEGDDMFWFRVSIIYNRVSVELYSEALMNNLHHSDHQHVQLTI